MTELNLVVSSWPGAGGTTVALILSRLLNLRYIYAGGVLKDWARKMGYDPASNDFHKWEEMYGEAWDRFWEDYVKNLLSNSNNFLCEGKTLGFLLPKDRAFEVMVVADSEIRAGRASTDMRSEDISARDSFLQKRWVKLFGIDIFDKEDVNLNYNLLLDNSELEIAESIKLILENLQSYLGEDSNYKPEVLISEARDLEQKFWHEQKQGRSGKDFLKSYLLSNGLYLTNEEIYRDWVANYQTELSKLPQEMAEAIVVNNQTDLNTSK